MVAAVVPPPAVSTEATKSAIADVKTITARPIDALSPSISQINAAAVPARVTIEPPTAAVQPAVGPTATSANVDQTTKPVNPLVAKDLPLIVARASVLPAPTLITASLAPIKLVQDVALRRRDNIRALPPPRKTLRVTERKTLPATDGVPLSERAIVAAIPREKPIDPPAASDVPAPPVHIGVVKKSTAYTVISSWTDNQIADAKAACAQLLKSSDIIATEAPPEREGSCGAPAPINVRQIGAPKVQINPSALLTCPMAAALNTWMTDKVQPAAISTFGQPVTKLISASSYSCRNRYGAANTPLSEHALINALDLSGFVLADGRTIRVLQDWGPVARDAAKRVAEVKDDKQNTKTDAKTDAKPELKSDAKAVVTVAVNTSKAPLKTGLSMLGGKTLAKPVAAKDDKSATGSADKIPIPEDSDKGSKARTAEADFTARRSAFLHRVHDDACDVFGTVLGPEANDAHRNHFHLDMKARRHKAFCQ